MTAEQFEREKKYQAAVAVARSMLKKGVIDEQDFLRVEEKMREKFRPVLGGFLLLKWVKRLPFWGRFL